MKRSVALTFLAIFLLLTAGFLVVGYRNPQNNAGFVVLETCIRQAGALYLPEELCLRRTVRELLDNNSPVQILAYADADAAPTALRANCHDIGHVVGEETFKRSRSLESTLSQCAYSCNNACIHGAVGAALTVDLGTGAGDIAHADAATIAEMGGPYCRSAPALCHGIGHVIAISLPEYEKGLDICTEIATGVRREACYQGVVIESFGGRQSLRFASATVEATGDYAFPCNDLALPFQHACFRYLPGFHATYASAGSSAEVRSSAILRCSELTAETRAYCFEGIGYDGGITQSNLDNFGDVEDICLSLPLRTDRATCSVGVVQKYINYDQVSSADRYCSRIADPEEKKACEDVRDAAVRNRSDGR